MLLISTTDVIFLNTLRGVIICYFFASDRHIHVHRSLPSFVSSFFYKAAKRLARQEKFGFVNAEAEKTAKSAQLMSEQAEKKAKRIARFGEDTQQANKVKATPAKSTSTSSTAKTGGGRGSGGGGGRGGRGKRGRGGGGRGGGGGGGGRRHMKGPAMSATTMLSQGLKSTR